MVLKTRIIRIGNSQGVRIPKPLLEQSGIEDEVELEVHDKRIIIHAAAKPRQSWDDAFAEMASLEDDVPFDPGYIPSTWDDEEWEW